MKKNRTRNQPVSNTLLGLSTHCRFFYSILFIKNTKAKDNIANLWRCLLDDDFDYYFHSRLWMWTIIHSSSISMVCWFIYHMPTSFFPQTYSDNGWLQPAILNQHTFIHFSIQWNYPFLVFHYLLIHNLYIHSLLSRMQFLISLLTFEQSHHFLPSLWDTIQYRHLINYCPPIFSESSFLKHNQALDNN